MKDGAVSKKQKRARSLSNSSPFTISDDDSPKPKKYKDKKPLHEKQSHRKHHKHSHKHHKSRSADFSSEDEEREKNQVLEKNGKQKNYDTISAVRVKEEPVTEDENERKHKHRSEQSRVHTDSSRRDEGSHHREESRRRNEHSGSRSTSDRSRRPVKEEDRSETEPEWGKKDIKKEKKEPAKNNAKPDFGLSGKLTEDANTFNGVVIKYSEPPEARKPKRRWRLYPFKGENSLPVLHIHRQSAYLLGRDRKVADIPIDHPSCSKQHAALQYRLVPFTRSNGSSGRQIKLYVIDLESANGTFLNNVKVEPKKYYELKERDVVKFGFSSREYVLLHEHSKDSENDDDVTVD